MKMVKKILLGLALAGTVLALAGCSMGDDKQMEKDGDKWDFTATVDHLNIDKKKGTKYETDKLYKRAWTQLGNKESVSKIKTKITFYADDVTSYVKRASDEDAIAAQAALYPDEAKKKAITANPAAGDAGEYFTLKATGNDNEKKKAVVGFLFDLHKTKNTAGETVYDFILLGIRPSEKDYYIERYYNVPENAMKTPTSLGTLWAGASTNVEYITATQSSFIKLTDNDKAKLVSGKGDDDRPTVSFDVTVTQANGKYTLKFLDQTYTIDSNKIPNRGTKNEDKDGVLKGGAGVYSNAPLGTKATIISNVDKDNTEGLYEEVEE